MFLYSKPGTSRRDKVLAKKVHSRLGLIHRYDEVILFCLLHVVTTIDPLTPYLGGEVVKSI